MAKKITKSFTATIIKNVLKGGSWLATVTISEAESGSVEFLQMAPWANASAAKRWVKEVVRELTPRKSIKLVATDKVDEKGKPTSFTGAITYKA